ncbi:unnamed protein product [Anisakis simplex]|uniref:Polyglutamine-binding protein 1 (inferred by orthology to a human protein) n=1 Tax=Anisakis simplex TaxID=6269 RepID=A0A0M3JWF4_ANISI|nr:unnamed protein product [Anisakis simplex]
MPLPPALMARLKRRGIIQEDANEEVIAENYDAEATSVPQKSTRSGKDTNASGAVGCPNKYNPYHYCVQFCYDHWKDGTSENSLPKAYTEERLKILKKYPLPSGWKEVYDPGCARHYYWYPRTDEVSWLPPRHPLAVIGDAAPKVSKDLFEKRENTNGVGVDMDNKEIGGDRERRMDENEVEKNSLNEKEGGSYRRDEMTKRDVTIDRLKQRKRKGFEDDGDKLSMTTKSNSDDERRPELNERDKLRRAKRKGIDPMDPAAYGDNVPVGKWSSGLHAHDRTGADVTASGPLFQQRPYPAPGAVLRRQQQDQTDQ